MPRLALVVLYVLVAATSAQASGEAQDVRDTTRALDDARVQSQQAGRRAERLETQASLARAVADRTAQQAAAVAARIQQAEAEVAGKAAQMRLIEAQDTDLRTDVARRRQPLVRLIAALQLRARRPLTLALFRPGSVIDIVHTCALIESIIPEIQRRTAASRAEIAHGDALQGQLQQARLALRNEELALAHYRQALAELETRQRLAARFVSGSADREAERALAMSEQARDLGSLIDGLGKADNLRAQPTALPGPVLRPDRPGQVAPPSALKAGFSTYAGPLAGYILPLTGQFVAGFGDIRLGARSRGISIATQAGAQVVAPASGRVAFAGPYRGYGRIVIVTHDDGWTSLITGMADLDVRIGDTLVAGSPLGIAGPGRPVLTLELRHHGEPVNPLDYARR